MLASYGGTWDRDGLITVGARLYGRGSPEARGYGSLPTSFLRADVTTKDGGGTPVARSRNARRRSSSARSSGLHELEQLWGRWADRMLDNCGGGASLASVRDALMQQVPTACAAGTCHRVGTWEVT